MAGVGGDDTVTIFKSEGFLKWKENWSGLFSGVQTRVNGRNYSTIRNGLKCDLRLYGIVVIWNALELNRLVLNLDPIPSIDQASCSKAC